MRAPVLSIRHLHVNFILKSYFLALGVNDNFLSNVVRLNTQSIDQFLYCKKKNGWNAQQSQTRKDADQKVHRMQQINKKADKTVLESWQ